MNVVLSLLLLILFVIAVGKLAGRLLGIRLGHLRGAIVGLLGWVAGLLAAIYIVGEPSEGWRRLDVETAGDGISVIAIVLVFGVLAAMPVAIVHRPDARRTGAPRGPRRRRRRLLHPIRAVRAALAPYGRLRELVANARKENLLHFRYASRSALESPDLSRRLRAVLEDSGGMLVKLGQIASTRTDVLPAATTDELAKLHADVERGAGGRAPEGARDRARRAGRAGVRRRSSSSRSPPRRSGRPTERCSPTARRWWSRSSGRGWRRSCARDGAVLRLAARTLERRVEAARAIGCGELQRGADRRASRRSSTTSARRGGHRLRANRADDVGVAIPAVHRTLTTRRVLVMEEVVGRPLTDAGAVDRSPVAREELARRLLTSFLGQILQDGYYHADPHPGNILLDDEGTLWLLDFGSVGRLDRGHARGPARRSRSGSRSASLADRARRATPGRRRGPRHARARARHGGAARRGSRARRPRAPP